MSTVSNTLQANTLVVNQGVVANDLSAQTVTLQNLNAQTITATGSLSAAYLYGNGCHLTGTGGTGGTGGGTTTDLEAVGSNVIPDTTGAYDIGSAALQFNNLFLSGNVTAAYLSGDGSMLTGVQAVGNVIADFTHIDTSMLPTSTNAAPDIGSAHAPWRNVLASNVTAKNVTANNVTASNVTASTMTATDVMATHFWVPNAGGEEELTNFDTTQIRNDLIPVTDSAYDIGSGDHQFNNLFLSGDINATNVTAARFLKPDGTDITTNGTAAPTNFNNIETNMLPATPGSLDIGVGYARWRNAAFSGTVTANRFTGDTSIVRTTADIIPFGGPYSLGGPNTKYKDAWLSGNVTAARFLNPDGTDITTNGTAAPTDFYNIETNMLPATNASLDIGVGAMQWRNAAFSGTVTANRFTGDTSIVRTTADIIPLGGPYSLGGPNTKYKDAWLSGNVYATYFVGDGSRLSGMSGTLNTHGTTFEVASGNYNYASLVTTRINGVNIGRGAGNGPNPEYCTAVGLNALGGHVPGFATQAAANVAGTRNSAFGQNALGYNSSGSDNTAVGSSALLSTTTGQNNVAVGSQANRDANSTNSTALGANTIARSSNTTAVGYNAQAQLEGSIAIGYGAQAIHKYSTAIGNAAVTSAAAQIMLGSTNTTVMVNKGMTNVSDRLDKTDIRPTQLGLEFINALTPVDYHFDFRADYSSTQIVSSIQVVGDPSVDAYQRLLTYTDAQMPRVFVDGTATASLSANANALTVNVTNPGTYDPTADPPTAYIDGYPDGLSLAVTMQTVPGTRDGSKKHPEWRQGVVAQDVETVAALPQFYDQSNNAPIFGGVWKNSNNDNYAVSYTEFIGPLIKACQDLDAKLTAAQARITALESNKTSS